MGILNSVMPILTDSILLMHIVIERMEHSKSPWRLVMTMAAPVLLKFGRLANAAIYIAACAEFVLSSVKSGDGVPDMDMLGAAQAQSMQIACTLQMIDNSSVDLLFPNRSNALTTQRSTSPVTNSASIISTLSNNDARRSKVSPTVRFSSVYFLFSGVLSLPISQRQRRRRHRDSSACSSRQAGHSSCRPS